MISAHPCWRDGRHGEIARTCRTGELAGAGTVSALLGDCRNLAGTEIVLPAAAVPSGADLLVKYGTPPDRTRGAGGCERRSEASTRWKN